MPKKTHLRKIEQGVKAWNSWRQENPKIVPDLSVVDLSGLDLEGVNLSYADLYHSSFVSNAQGADFTGAELSEAFLRGADLRGADFSGASMISACLSHTNLSGATLFCTDLRDADLEEALLVMADLNGALLSDAVLRNADLSRATIGETTFGDNDLSMAKGLETLIHTRPSTIGVDTLFRSDGKIPSLFLRGAGVPEDFITFVPSLVGRAIEFYSCFISYNHQDEEFSRRLHSRMRSENLRVWYAPDDIKGGRKLHEEIFRAIQIHDKLLVVLSEHSMKSEWVMSEIRRARKVEKEENRRKLFPIRLVHFDAIEKWECFDADSGKDLAVDLREYYIPDFSNWKHHDAFEAEFAKLLRDLKTSER